MSEMSAKDMKQLAEIFLRHPVSGCQMFLSSGIKLEEDGKSFSFTVASADGSKRIKHTVVTEEI